MAQGSSALPNGQSEAAIRAIRAFNEKNYALALEIYHTLARAEKDELLDLAGISYYMKGDMDTARRVLEESAQKSGSFLSLKFLAFIYYETEDLKRSVDSAQSALRLRGDPELSELSNKAQREFEVQSGFIHESALHFKVFYDGYEHGGINRKVLDILEDAYSRVGGELGYFPSEPITVILYTKKDFHDTTRVPEWTMGVYDGKIRLPVGGALRSEGLLKKVLFHEYVHAVVRKMTRNCPLWINEGLAEYFSGAKAKSGQAIPLRSLERSFFHLDRSSVDAAYVESFSAVSHLVESYGVHSTRKMLESLGKGSSANNAFLEAFGLSYDDFVSKWGK